MLNKKFDYTIAGAGLFGTILARKLAQQGNKVQILEARDHIAGQLYTHREHNTDIHDYGAHIFRTNDDWVWEFVNEFVTFVPFVNSPMAFYKGKMYNMPFNMNTFNQIFGATNPKDAKEAIDKTRFTGEPTNLEEKAQSLVGTEIYEILIKGYTEKQWGRKATDLPASIIRRLPLRFTFDNNYFNAKYQGIPDEGYTALIEGILEKDVPEGSIVVHTGVNVTKKMVDDNIENFGKVIFTGPIDKYYGESLGKLAYRSLVFEHKYFPDIENYQGNAVVNYTDGEVPYTRVLEHKHFNRRENQTGTHVSWEYPAEHDDTNDPYYPINDDFNNELYEKYAELAKEEGKVVFGGRLGNYKYFDMQDTIKSAHKMFEAIQNNEVTWK